ncbi:MAG: ATP-dependent helicase [Proteobacteria bacterium]|nr:ATP-dependent helicase [Pseudomonadota bacterium]
MTIKLNEQQAAAVDHPGNVLVTACPGSGKTRVLTHRIIKELSELESTKHRVIAVTFTNRAADEIKSRLDDPEICLDQLWAGTIHSFSLDWILRPYACYSKYLKKGFSVADEFYIRRLKNNLKEKYGFNYYDEIETKFDRNGNTVSCSTNEKEFINEYHKLLFERKLIDFDLVLYFTYELMIRMSEIPKTLGAIIRSICIDEYQDTQDLQYGILSEIVKKSSGFTKVFIVGDVNQAIYSSLGGIAKSRQEIIQEFEIDQLAHLRLTGNYRSTQRIIDLSIDLQDDETEVVSLANYADERGIITFNNQDYHKDDLPELIAKMVAFHINNGVPSHEICILAPQWWLITSLGRKLVTILPDVKFDAPGLSPFHHQRDNIWFKIARLFLVEPEPRLFLPRLRWAGSVIRELEYLIGTDIPDEYRTARRLLRLTNTIKSAETDGIAYLEDVFHQLMMKIKIIIDDYSSLMEPWDSFFAKAYDRLKDPEYNIPSDIISLKKMFKRPGGVVVTTCHSIKGEEYETVICYGILEGYIPNWQLIYDSNVDENIEARRLLYVISSRAKKNLHLISELGRMTQRGHSYCTNQNIDCVTCEYDELNIY